MTSFGGIQLTTNCRYCRGSGMRLAHDLAWIECGGGCRNGQILTENGQDLLAFMATYAPRRVGA